MQDSAITLLCNKTMEAAARIAAIRGLTPDAGELSEALKTTVKANLDRILTEWKEALEANIGEGWLGTMIQAQATELAMEALGITTN